MITGFKVEARGIEELTKMLRTIGEDLTPAWYKIAEDLKAVNADRFATSGFGTWAPLAPSTIASRQYPGMPILIQSRRLYDSYTSGLTVAVEPKQVEVGSSSPIAHFHEYGTRRMPARPVFEPRSIDFKRWIGIIEEEIGRQTKR